MTAQTGRWVARHTTARRARAERGSLALEMAMVAPALLLILGLIYAYGRVAEVRGQLESSARDAARSATVARSQEDAVSRAERVVDIALEQTPASCQDSRTVAVSEPFEAGEPVTVSVSCTFRLDDLGLPGAPGSVSPTSRFTSMLDPNRGLEP